MGIQEGAWVTTVDGYVGRVISVWGPYAKVEVRLGGSIRTEGHRLDELRATNSMEGKDGTAE